MSRLFDEDTWKGVGEQLSGASKEWWTDNRDGLTELAVDEAKDLFAALKKGDTISAKMEIVARMSPDEWKAYRDGTTENLRGIAARRAKLLDAVEDLSRKLAKAIGKTVFAALGL